MRFLWIYYFTLFFNLFTSYINNKQHTVLLIWGTSLCWMSIPKGFIAGLESKGCQPFWFHPSYSLCEPGNVWIWLLTGGKVRWNRTMKLQFEMKMTNVLEVLLQVAQIIKELFNLIKTKNIIIVIDLLHCYPAFLPNGDTKWVISFLHFIRATTLWDQ